MTVTAGTSTAYTVSSVTVAESELMPAQSIPASQQAQSGPYVSILNASAHSRYLDHQLVLDLLEDTSLVDADALAEVMKTAAIKEASLLDVLFDGCFIALSDKRDLMSAYDAVSQGFLYQPWAKKALQSALSQFIPFEEMLFSMGLHPTNAFSESFLAELALSTELITISQMERARLLCLSRGLTLGQALVQLGLINIATYKLLIDSWSRYRNGHLSQTQLREMVQNYFAGFNSSTEWLKLSQSVRGFGIFCGNLDLLEALDLLVEAELLNEITILGVMESALERHASFEQISAQCSMVEPALLTLAMKLQKRVHSGETTHNSACQILRERCALLAQVVE